MYSQIQFVRKFFFLFNYVILACILLFSTSFLHFHTLHTFTSLFYIHSYAKSFIFTFNPLTPVTAVTGRDEPLTKSSRKRSFQ